MDTLTGITSRSTYEQCVAHINAAVKDFLYDQEGQIEVSEDEVWTDLAAALLVDASENVAREICRIQLGWVPQSLERLWQERARAKKEADRKRVQERAAAKKEKRAQDARDALAAEREAVRAARCPNCFTVKAPSGACNC